MRAILFDKSGRSGYIEVADDGEFEYFYSGSENDVEQTLRRLTNQSQRHADLTEAARKRAQAEKLRDIGTKLERLPSIWRVEISRL